MNATDTLTVQQVPVRAVPSSDDIALPTAKTSPIISAEWH
jgi:hypothetical protein